MKQNLNTWNCRACLSFRRRGSRAPPPAPSDVLLVIKYRSAFYIPTQLFVKDLRLLRVTRTLRNGCSASRRGLRVAICPSPSRADSGGRRYNRRDLRSLQIIFPMEMKATVVCFRGGKAPIRRNPGCASRSQPESLALCTSLNVIIESGSESEWHWQEFGAAEHGVPARGPGRGGGGPRALQCHGRVRDS
jgi:hypothetical protein